jgi:hypothetical protein
MNCAAVDTISGTSSHEAASKISQSMPRLARAGPVLIGR